MNLFKKLLKLSPPARNQDSNGPPTAPRVAARALVLAGVIYRAEMEGDRSGETERWRKKPQRWIDALHLRFELERSERDLLHTPTGVADPGC